MRVLHVVRSDSFAGVERHIVRLACAQSAAGDVVHVLGGDPVRMRAELAVAPAVRFTPAATVPELVRVLDRTTLDVDVVNAHMTAAELALALSGSLPGRHLPPVVSTRHFAAPRGRGTLGRAAGRFAGSAVDAQIAISDYVARAIEPPSTVVLAGVEDQPDARPAAVRERIVLMAQRLEAEKHTDVGVRAFAASGLAQDGWRLLVAGEGACRDQLARLADELGLGAHLELLGRRSDVDRLMAAAAVMLAPAQGEHLGLSVLEAMAAGLPVVADGSGGHVESLAGLSDHALYRSRSVQDAAAHLRSLADDDAARDAYTTAAQARQRSRFTIERQRADTDAVYRSVA